MVPNQSPVQPVVMEGGWTEQTQEEIKLMECIRHREVCSLGLKTLKTLPLLYAFKSTVLNFKIMPINMFSASRQLSHVGICQALSWHLERSSLKGIQLIGKYVLFEWRPEIVTLAKKKKRPSGYVQR